MKKLQFGTGRGVITPETPSTLAGYFTPRVWNEVLDDLEVRALVMKDGDAYAWIIQVDLLFVNTALYNAAMQAFAAAGLNEITPQNLIFAATHTHTAPDTHCLNTVAARPYIDYVAPRIAQAAKAALASLREGDIEIGLAVDRRFAFNRRYWMKDGTVATNPGSLNPDIDRPEGEVDHEIPLFAIRENGRLAVLLANIVNHTDTIGGHGVSADWPGILIRALEPKLGPDSLVIPLVGASGNINSSPFMTENPFSKGYAKTQIVGRGYAETIEKALPELKKMPFHGFRAMSADLAVGSREITPAELAEAKATVEKYADLDISFDSPKHPTAWEGGKQSPGYLKQFAARLIAASELPTPLVFHLTGFDFGAVAFASLPGEPFVELGLILRKEIFHGKTAFCVSHSNGTGSERNGSGYVPNLWNYGRGGYETTVRSNPFEMMTAAKLLNTWRRLAEQQENS